VKGIYVQNIQDFLNTFGYYKSYIDGDFGINTENAVRAFQKAKGLKDDGIVGPLTREIMSKDINTKLK